MTEKILITSALPYVNNVPHMGNIIGSVLSADVFARFKRSQGKRVLYVCGTDEHGTTTEAKAKEEGLTPRQVCDKYYALHKEVYEWFDISFDIFGRTSEQNHHEIVQGIYQDLKGNGYILEKEIEQLYDEEAKSFLADRFVSGTCPHCSYERARGDQCEQCGKLLEPTQLKDPRSALSGTTPRLKKTTHLYLDLEKLQPTLEPWVKEQSEKGSWTNNARTTTKAWLERGLEPRAITRDLEWGVPVPGMPGKVFYVWFDAPIGYISITGQLEGTDYKDWWQSPGVKLYQFMAKDNIPFHTILFPATLMGTGNPWVLLHHINATEYLQHEDGKFSKSRGTGLFGDDAMRTGIRADVYRYYLLINRPEKADTMFAWSDLQEKLNNELLANLGNLVNRTLQFIKNYQDGRIAAAVLTQKDENFLEWVHEEAEQVAFHLERAEEKEALRKVMLISNKANTYFQEERPWQTRKDAPEECRRSLYVLANVIKDLAILLEPFLPQTSERIFSQLGIGKQEWRCLGELLFEDHAIGEVEPLFEKLDDARLEEIKARIATPEEKEAPKPLRIQAGRIVDVYRHPDAERLFVEEVDFGSEMRTIVSGLVGRYTQEELRGKVALFATNLQPAKLRGVESQGMILCAQRGEDDFEVLFAQAEAGTLVEGASAGKEEITIDEFARHTLEVKDHAVLIDGKAISVAGKPVRTSRISDGKVA